MTRPQTLMQEAEQRGDLVYLRDSDVWACGPFTGKTRREAWDGYATNAKRTRQRIETNAERTERERKELWALNRTRAIAGMPPLDIHPLPKTGPNVPKMSHNRPSHRP